MSLGRCAGERRSCSATATVIRQGRALCSTCDDIRRASTRDRKARKRRRPHDDGRCEGAPACLYCRARDGDRERVEEAVAAEVIRGKGRPPKIAPDAPPAPPAAELVHITVRVTPRQAEILDDIVRERAMRGGRAEAVRWAIDLCGYGGE